MTARELAEILMKTPNAKVFVEQVIDYISGTIIVELTDEDVCNTVDGDVVLVSYQKDVGKS